MSKLTCNLFPKPSSKTTRLANSWPIGDTPKIGKICKIDQDGQNFGPKERASFPPKCSSRRSGSSSRTRSKSRSSRNSSSISSSSSQQLSVTMNESYFVHTDIEPARDVWGTSARGLLAGALSSGRCSSTCRHFAAVTASQGPGSSDIRAAVSLGWKEWQNCVCCLCPDACL